MKRSILVMVVFTLVLGFGCKHDQSGPSGPQVPDPSGSGTSQEKRNEAYAKINKNYGSVLDGIIQTDRDAARMIGQIISGQLAGLTPDKGLYELLIYIASTKLMDLSTVGEEREQWVILRRDLMAICTRLFGPCMAKRPFPPKT